MTEYLTKAIAIGRIPDAVEAPISVVRGRSASDARLRMIRVLQEIPPGGFIYETRIYKRFSSKRTKQEIADVLAEFLSKGYIHRLGTGRRGDACRIILSSTWPHNRCPLCNHIEYPTVSKDNQEEIDKP
jgi:hypothetical protein